MEVDDYSMVVVVVMLVAMRIVLVLGDCESKLLLSHGSQLI